MSCMSPTRTRCGVGACIHVSSPVQHVFSCSSPHLSKWLFVPSLLAGLMPWALDLVHRWSQGGSVTTFTAANLSDDKSITTLQLTTARVRLSTAHSGSSSCLQSALHSAVGALLRGKLTTNASCLWCCCPSCCSWLCSAHAVAATLCSSVVVLAGTRLQVLKGGDAQVAVHVLLITML